MAGAVSGKFRLDIRTALDHLNLGCADDFPLFVLDTSTSRAPQFQGPLLGPFQGPFSSFQTPWLP